MVDIKDKSIDYLTKKYLGHLDDFLNNLFKWVLTDVDQDTTKAVKVMMEILTHELAVITSNVLYHSTADERKEITEILIDKLKCYIQNNLRDEAFRHGENI